VGLGIGGVCVCVYMCGCVGGKGGKGVWMGLGIACVSVWVGLGIGGVGGTCVGVWVCGCVGV